MNLEDDLTPPARLALAYAPQRVRVGFALLLQLDNRLANIVANVTEPLIGQMKLAWWRDAIGSDPAGRPKGEPLLSQLFALDVAVLNDAATRLVDAWEILIIEQDWSVSAISRFAAERGRALFGGYAMLLGTSDFPEQIAAEWAADDLRLRFGDKVAHTGGDPIHPMPKSMSLRPLTILAMSVRDISGPRLIWHVLTGR